MVTNKDKLLASAQKYLERGVLDKALAEFQKAVAEDPKDTRTWLRIAELHVKRGATAEATEVYKKTADLYVEQGFFQRAVAVYKNVLKLSPNYLEGYARLAEIFKQLGLLSDAAQQYEQAAGAFTRTGRTREALAALRQIVELNPDQVVARIRLAEAASQAGQRDEAIAEFARAAEQLKAQGRIDEYLRVAERLFFHQADNLDLAKQIAAMYIARNNARYALSKLQQCFKAQPRDVETLSLLSRAFEQLGQIPKTISVLKELAKVYSEMGNVAERNMTVQRILALDPSEPEAVEASQRLSYVGPPPQPRAPGARPQAALGGEGGRPDTTGKITFTEMAVPPTVTDASALVLSDDPRGPATTGERVAIAEGMLERSEEEVAGEVNRIITEADLFVKYGLLERAIEHLRKVFEVLPTHAAAHERLAAIFLQLGRTGEAVVELEVLAEQIVASRPQEASVFAERALALDPKAPRARRVLERIVKARADAEAAAAQAEVMAKAPTTGSGIPVPLEDGDSFLEISDTTSAAAAILGDDDDAGEGGLVGAFDRVAQTIAETPIDEILSEELEQVDFFMAQNLIDDARALLDELEVRYPTSFQVAGRRARLPKASPRPQSGAVPRAPLQGGGSTTRRGLPTVDPLSGATIAADASEIMAGEAARDAEAHAELGVTYKEMGLYDAAVKEFLVLARDPAREVCALTMIGECHEANGQTGEAMSHYKKALNLPQVTEEESVQLYFQLGCVFETLGDGKEALYYYEKVAKRSPAYKDIARRLAGVRGGGGISAADTPGDSGDGFDFDSVVTKTNPG